MYTTVIRLIHLYGAFRDLERRAEEIIFFKLDKRVILKFVKQWH